METNLGRVSEMYTMKCVNPIFMCEAQSSYDEYQEVNTYDDGVHPYTAYSDYSDYGDYVNSGDPCGGYMS